VQSLPNRDVIDEMENHPSSSIINRDRRSLFTAVTAGNSVSHKCGEGKYVPVLNQAPRYEDQSLA
jgi:hypothetical protein